MKTVKPCKSGSLMAAKHRRMDGTARAALTGSPADAPGASSSDGRSDDRRATA